MRILHILHISLPYLCGYSIRSNYILTCQRSFGLDVSAVTSTQQPNYYKSKEIIDDICYWRSSPSNFSNIPLMRELSMMNSLKANILKALKEFQPDIIHAHSSVLVGLPAYQASAKNHIPMVYEIRDCWENASVDRGKFKNDSLQYKTAKYLDTFVMKRANAVVTICNALKQEVVSRQVDENKIYIVNNGVDSKELCSPLKDTTIKNDFNLKDKQIIGYIGTFQPYEGLDLLVKAMPEILYSVPNAHLLIVGSGGVENDLRNLTHDFNLDGHITFAGRIAHNEITSAYSIMKVLVYPRRYTRTTALTTPLKPMEAMALEKPVIVSDVPAMLELVNPGITGFTFKAGSIEDLAKTCINALNNRLLCSNIATEAKHWVEKERQWPDLILKYNDIYNSILSKG